MDIDPLWASWFVGFVDGEGSFQVQRSGRLPGGRPRNMMPHLQIQLRKDDRALIEDIHRTLGVGRVYEVTKRADRVNGKKAADQVMWRCRDIGELVSIIVPLFDTYPLKSKKASEYAIWRCAVMVKWERGNCGLLWELKQALMAERRAGLNDSEVEIPVYDEQPRLL